MYTPIIVDRGHLAVEEMLIEHFSPKYNNCQVSKRSGRKPYGIAQLQELCFNFHPRSKMATPKPTCDVCGSENIIEAPHMGTNCNDCHPI
jgi:hypothetical protein